MKMKKILTIFCLGLAMCLTGCSDDDDNENKKDEVVEFVPFSLTATLPVREASVDEGSLLQGDWEQGAQLAMIQIGTPGIDKSVLALSSGDIFSGEISSSVKNEDEVVALYPADAFIPATNDMLTQEIRLSGQDGTLDGVARYDFAWGKGKAAMNGASGSSAMEMSNLMHIGKFNFTTSEGASLTGISSITVTALEGTLYSGGTFSMKNGKFDTPNVGSFTLKNSAGMPATIYISFIPSEAKLHFTLVTTDGKIYEAAASESIVMVAGTIAATRTLVCTPLPMAKVGDYYYSDATYSTIKDDSKTCIGIVYALSDEKGNIDHGLTSSPYGRIVALEDAYRYTTWTRAGEELADLGDIKNYTYVKDTLSIACLPYYNGSVDSYSSDESKEWIAGLNIDAANGAVMAWPSQGVLTDFQGAENTLEAAGSGAYTHPAMAYSYQYSCEGKGVSEWYLPAAGELALLWTLQRTGVISGNKQEGFVDFSEMPYWTSSEHSDSKAWYIHFLNGMIVANNKSSTYHIRAVSAF